MNPANIHPAYRLILPYLRQIENLILDPDISEIMLNSPTDIFIEKQGVMEQVQGITIPTDQLRVAVQNIARSLGDDISEEKPILDSRLPDGSRIAAVLPPCSIHGITLTIRKFNTRSFTIDDLIRIGTITQPMADLLKKAIQDRKNILISGGTGTGKTTLLNILADFIPDEDRLVVIEDTAEIHIRKPNLVRFEARRQQGPKIPAVTIRDLLKASLRHRPERTILGEIRGEEAFDLLQALNTGHSGSLSTIHANSASQALSRLASCVLQSGIELPYKAIKANIADSIHLLVHIERRHAKRFISEILELRSYSPTDDQYTLNPLYQNQQKEKTRI
ncbi:MAG TPA: ATPase, T2SS/T4P/T4SS family [Candidatus Angelobacter sp.]|nr:ATPase, T2SS/T4P/T4SS family [Candidatus Angelobacter sp.]